MSKHSAKGADWEATRLRVLDRDGWQCQECGIDIEGFSATVDHVVPRSKGGADEDWNLVSLCRPCNATKGDRVTYTRFNYLNPTWA